VKIARAALPILLLVALFLGACDATGIYNVECTAVPARVEVDPSQEEVFYYSNAEWTEATDPVAICHSHLGSGWQVVQSRLIGPGGSTITIATPPPALPTSVPTHTPIPETNG
jgi:hypothetical protein